MRKILKSIRSKITKIIPCILTALTLVCNPIVSLTTTAYAAPAVAPVGAELLGELLVALGLATGDDTVGFDWRIDSPGGRNLYTTDIFGNVVPKIKKGQTVTAEELKPLLGTVIPDGVYETDGTNFYVAGKPLTTDDLFLKAKALAGVSYGIPLNIDGAQAFSSINKTSNFAVVYTPISDAVEGNDYYFVPYFLGNSGSSYIIPVALHFNTPTTCILYDYRTGAQTSGDGFTLGRYMAVPAKYSAWFQTSDSSNGYSNGSQVVYLPTQGSTASNSTSDKTIFWSQAIITITGDGSDKSNSTKLDAYKLKSGTLLRTKGVPVLELEGDKEKLENAIVQVKKDDDDNNGNLPSGQQPAPQSPNNWEIWKSIEDLVKFIDTGEVNNGNTDYGDFVSNNYNYVNVDVNVPDEIDTNVNITGDVTIHEDISIPGVTEGDGEGFFNADAIDAIAALTVDNPAVQLIKGLFEAIDPVLVGIFSVGVSLLVVLGIWKLIRG